MVVDASTKSAGPAAATGLDGVSSDRPFDRGGRSL
jgi:hypothetical protein